MFYLAIDQHRKQLTVNLRNEHGDVLIKRQVSTRWEPVRKFFAEIRDLARPDGGFTAIVEVCGFNDWLLEMLRQFECRETVLIQAERRSKRKTDRRDADALGELLWVNRHRLLGGQKPHHLRRVILPSRESRENRQLAALRRRLSQCRTQTINKVRHLLRKHNLDQECPTKGIDTKAARRWLASIALDEIDRLEMNLLLAQWQLFNEQLARVEEKLSERHRCSKDAKLLSTIPGAGIFNSIGLTASIGDIHRFPTPQSLPNYWGIVPGCRNSGEATDRLGSITKQGSSMARFILGQMVMHVLRRDARMRDWYRRIKHRRGSKIARVAVMRRLAMIIWHMLKHERPYVLNGLPPVREPSV